jgi:hypothetical protein
MEASMFTNPFTSTAQDNLANQLQAFMALAHTAFDGGTKLLELNTNLGKARLEQSSIALRQLMMEGPQEYLPFAVKQAQHNIESTFSHCRHVAALFASTQAEMSKIVQANIPDAGDGDGLAKKNDAMINS